MINQPLLMMEEYVLQTCMSYRLQVAYSIPLIFGNLIKIPVHYCSSFQFVKLSILSISGIFLDNA